MTTTWTISIDWDRNGNFTDTYADVTTRTLTSLWFLGAIKPYQDIADDSALELVLNNSDRQFSPENSASPLFGKLLPQRPVRIQSDDGATVRTHWTGWVDQIMPVVGKYGERLTRIRAIGSLQYLKATETRLPLQENKRTDEIIAELIKEVVMPPALNRAWVLGRAGNSELGATTYDLDRRQMEDFRLKPWAAATFSVFRARLYKYEKQKETGVRSQGQGNEVLHTGFEVNSVHSVDAAIARFVLMLYAGQPEPTEPVNNKSKTETERNEDIRRRFSIGQSIGNIARHYGLSKQRVHQIIHGRRK